MRRLGFIQTETALCRQRGDQFVVNRINRHNSFSDEHEVALSKVFDAAILAAAAAISGGLVNNGDYVARADSDGRSAGL